MNNEEWASGDPYEHFQTLYTRALKSENFDPTRAALATADLERQPSVRFVLVRGMDDEGFVFYSDYRSRKAAQMEANPQAALAWHWSSIGVQIRAEGRVKKADEKMSDQYFSGRGRGSQIGAWASNQSSILAGRELLKNECANIEARFSGQEIERPAHWGGYRLYPERIEFWFDRDDRLHDRFEYLKEDSAWAVRRLSP